MARKPKKTISDSLTGAKLALTNSTGDPEIPILVARFGFDRTRLDEGMAIYDAADRAVDQSAAANGGQKLATDALFKARKKAMTSYQDLSTIVKLLVKGNQGALSKLGLDRPMPRSTAGFTTAGKILFDNAANDPVIMEKIGTRGYTLERLASERANIIAFAEADEVQEAAKGANRVAAAAETAAMKKLNDWMAEYKKIAKIALRDKKNLLEKLGIPVRTTKTAAQRNAGKKAAATRAMNRATSPK